MTRCNNPRVSVIVPVYNGAKYLEDAINSIVSQSYCDWELLVLDDGSYDESLTIAQEFAAQDSRIRVYSNECNLGLGRTMNRLTKLARAEFIAVQEQDDSSTPDRLAIEVSVLESDPNIGLVSGVAEWLDDEGRVVAFFPGILHRGETYPVTRQDMVAYLYVEQCKIVNAACMFRRSATGDIPGPFDEAAKMSIDWQFFLHLAHKCRIEGVSEVLVKMRRGRSHTHLTGQKELQFAEARRCINLIYNAYKDDPSSPVNYWLQRKAMAIQLTLEGRHFGRFKGASRLVHAILTDPTCAKAWLSLGWLAKRGYWRATELLRSST